MHSLEPVILFRSDLQTEAERRTASGYFHVAASRVGLRNKLVIGRYSVLPYYKELENDLKLQNSRLINSYSEHCYIASFDYYYDVEAFTPRTFFKLEDVPKDGGPFVVKGRTNSRKLEWNTKMFAPDYRAAAKIAGDLEMDDALIREQGAIVREYIPLESCGVGLNGLPFANEWRFFYYKNRRLCFGYYWTLSEVTGVISYEALAFADKVASIISKKANFFVLDIAEKATGGWTLIEVNDAQMSGLSGNFANHLYLGLLDALST